MAQAALVNHPSLENKIKPLHINEAITLLNSSSIDGHVTPVPYKAKAGEVYIYRSSIEKKDDWKTDGYRWSNEGSRDLVDKSIKRHNFYMHLGTDGRKRLYDKRFRKLVFSLKPPLEDDTYLSVIQYLGDETIFQNQPHGNSKEINKIFLPLKPSLKQSLKTEFDQNELKTAHKVYKEQVVKEVVNEITDKPRNVRQVQYLKHQVQDSNRLSRDAIVNLHALAYEDSSFIHVITTFPDLIVVCGLLEIVQELKLCLQTSPKNQQHLSYDTTFNMGDFFVSPIIFKHTMFTQKPTIPALFLLHEKKFAAHHKTIFEILEQIIESKSLLKDVPIVVDMEPGIVKALKSTDLKIIGCWRHLNDDNKRWVAKHGGNTDDKTVYTDHLYELLNCTTEEKFQETLDLKKVIWDEAYQTYFFDQILPKIDRYAR